MFHKLRFEQEYHVSKGVTFFFLEWKAKHLPNNNNKLSSIQFYLAWIFKKYYCYSAKDNIKAFINENVYSRVINVYQRILEHKHMYNKIGATYYTLRTKVTIKTYFIVG